MTYNIFSSAPLKEVESANVLFHEKHRLVFMKLILFKNKELISRNNEMKALPSMNLMQKYSLSLQLVVQNVRITQHLSTIKKNVAHRFHD